MAHGFHQPHFAVYGFGAELSILVMHHKFISLRVKKPIRNFFVVHGFDGAPPFLGHESLVPQIEFVVYEYHVPQIILCHVPQIRLCHVPQIRLCHVPQIRLLLTCTADRLCGNV
jgi:hypothetical protein